MKRSEASQYAPWHKQFITNRPENRSDGEKSIPPALSGILGKLGTLRNEGAVMVVLLSTILASMCLMLVPLVHLSALPFLLILTVFMLLGIRSLPKIEHSKDSVITEPIKTSKNSLHFGRNNYGKVLKGVKQAEIVRHVLHNPKTSISEIASTIEIHENITRELVEDLLKKENQVIIRNTGEIRDTFSINYDNFGDVVAILRKLTALEEQLINFGV